MAGSTSRNRLFEFARSTVMLRVLRLVYPVGAKRDGKDGPEIYALDATTVNFPGLAVGGVKIGPGAAVDAITAAATQTQAAATALTGTVNRVTTNATAGNGVRLPTSVAGLEVRIVNATANALQVYGASTDTINGVATATGISMPPNAVGIFVCPLAGVWFSNVGIGYSGSLFTESAKDSITAFAGGGQASATPLTAQTSRVATVVTAGDSVLLPPSAPGLELLVINHGANAMQVFGAGTDTIDDVATATGVSQMANSLVIYSCATAGAWYSEGLATGFAAAGLQTQSFAGAITAHAGGGQASAQVLAAMVNRVTTVGTAADSVKLPAATSGLIVTVINASTKAMQVFGAGTDTINGVATATGISQPASSVATYTCVLAGAWETDAVGQGFSGNFPTVSVTNGITAFATGGQASAVLLTSVINRVTTVATGADSVKLPPAIAGMQLVVTNAAAANSANVFPSTGDNINALAANSAFAVAANKTALFACAVAGTWNAVLTA